MMTIRDLKARAAYFHWYKAFLDTAGPAEHKRS